MYAVSEGHNQTIDTLISGGAELDTQDGEGWNALMVALQSEHVATAEHLLEHDSDIHTATKRGQTALMIAAGLGQDSMLQTLLERGAKTDAVRVDAFNCLMAASQGGLLDFATQLLDAGFDPNAADERGWAALFFAVLNAHAPVVGLLLQRGASKSLSDVSARRIHLPTILAHL